MPRIIIRRQTEIDIHYNLPAVFERRLLDAILLIGFNIRDF